MQFEHRQPEDVPVHRRQPLQPPVGGLNCSSDAVDLHGAPCTTPRNSSSANSRTLTPMRPASLRNGPASPRPANRSELVLIQQLERQFPAPAGGRPLRPPDWSIARYRPGHFHRGESRLPSPCSPSSSRPAPAPAPGTPPSPPRRPAGTPVCQRRLRDALGRLGGDQVEVGRAAAHQNTPRQTTASWPPRLRCALSATMGNLPGAGDPA
jgi:hypothetical protein